MEIPKINFNGAFSRIHFWETIKYKKGENRTRKKNFKGRYEKRALSKCAEVCRAYDAVQSVRADMLQADDAVREIKCHVPLDVLELGEYTCDFVCVKSDGDLMVRECVYAKALTKPLTVKLLDASREYWTRRGVTDWGLAINAEDNDTEI